MPVHIPYIRALLSKWEGRRATAYIPCQRRNFTGRNELRDCGPMLGASGVTVGVGLDLGQQRESDLRRMGMDEALLARFRPYLGKRRAAAVEALAAAPLSLSDEECEALDAVVHADYIRRAAARFDAQATTPFADCPAQAQAVIVSLFYQLGAPSKYPKTWKYLCACDWASAARELRSGFSAYAERRADEGRLLAEVAQ